MFNFVVFMKPTFQVIMIGILKELPDQIIINSFFQGKFKVSRPSLAAAITLAMLDID